MSSAVKDVAIVPIDAKALTPIEPASVMQMIERLASNADFDAAKLEKLIDLQMKVTDYQAKAAFDAAFPAMQAEIPTIPEKGKTNNGRYALLEDIVEIVRPILKRHGFSLSFRTEWPEKGLVRVVGILTHQDGHSRESAFQSAADESGNKNAVQALGSVVAYGQRYTAKDLIGIVSRGMDNDGGTPKATPAPPKGYDEWVTDLHAVSANGFAAVRKAEPRQTFFVRAFVVAPIERMDLPGREKLSEGGRRRFVEH